MDFGNDLRLLYLVVLNGAILFAAWHAARRWTRDPVQRAVDASLAWYLIQYAAVTLPGLAHVLSLASMSLVALGASAGLYASTRKSPPLTPELPKRDAWIFLAASAFLIAFLVQIIHVQDWTPLIDSDAITYHAPAAVQWLQTGKLGLFPTWFFNPANTFSPLAGSTFIAWALAPMSNDSLARFAQAPAIFLLFLAVLQLTRALGANALAAALLALAAAGGRLCSSEVANPRDDMFLAAFVLVAFAGCSNDRLQEKVGPWRVGAALGLALATKYTALISLPLLLLMIDAPIIAGWSRRRWLIALASPMVIAGPWYLRNLWLTGNPIFPLELNLLGATLLKGLFVTERSLRLRSLGGIKAVFIEGYHGLPTAAAWTLLVGYAIALVVARKRLREPMVRACMLGPVLCTAMFLAKSPYGEVRFLYPAIFIALGSVALVSLAPAALGERVGARRTRALLIAAVILFVAWLATSYKDLSLLSDALIPALFTVPITLGLLWADVQLSHAPRARAYAAAVGLLILASLVYSQWSPYVATAEYHAPELWRFPSYYPQFADAWQFVRDNVPADTTLAYTQTFNVYPLYDTRLKRRLVYVPVRPDVIDVIHVPHFPKPLPGEPINATFTALLNANADKTVWLARLKASGATHLFVYLGDAAPPEERFARETPGFTPIYEDKSVKVYELPH